MSQEMLSYTKSVLQKVSFDPILFHKELEKAIDFLLPYEIEELNNWLLKYTKKRPELKQALLIINDLETK